MDGLVAQLAARYRWDLIRDLTARSEHFSSVPVWEVSAEGQRRVLKAGLEPLEEAALASFSGSGVTPVVFKKGSVNGVSWALMEYIEGDTISVVAATAQDVGVFHRATDPVLSALKHLPHVPGRVAAGEGFLAKARALEHKVGFFASNGGPQCARVADEMWEGAVLLHGDVLPVNVIVQSSSMARLFDVTGGWGPPEADAGRWLASVVVMPERSVAESVEAARRLVRRCSARHTYRPRFLLGWTGYQVATYAEAMITAGVPAGDVRFATDLGARLVEAAFEESGDASTTVRSQPQKRNDRCACGSGKKYKHCCLHKD